MDTNNRGVKVFLGTLVLVILIGLVLAGGMMGPGMMGPWMMWGYGRPDTGPAVGNWRWGLTMAVGMLAMLAFWGALIVGAVLLIRRTIAQGRAEAPQDVLRRRYAAGEIDQTTYERMKQELRSELEDQAHRRAGAESAVK